MVEVRSVWVWYEGDTVPSLGDAGDERNCGKALGECGDRVGELPAVSRMRKNTNIDVNIVS